MKNVWFKAKRYGWGWYPATWQGWSILLVWIGALIMIYNTSTPAIFFISSIILTLLLIVVCWKKGEKPRWCWGKN